MSTDANISTVRELYVQAVRIEEEASRQAFLDEACRGEIELRQRVEGLLAARRADGDNLLQLATSDSISGQNSFSWNGDDIGKTIDSHPEAMGDDQTRHEASRGQIDVSTHPMIGNYRLLEELGHGGMGTVYMAAQSKPVKRQVALKVIKAGMDSGEVIARFEAERQALAMMDHPHIARVLDGGTTDEGRPYFVMELVRGVPITEFCKRKTLPLRERLELFVDVCHAVQHAHQKGIIHRDLKPSNIMVTLHDGKQMVKVIDFGVAKALHQELTERTLFTQFSQMLGTPLYMAPEQAEMSGLGVDTRSDIYSLGVVLYELLTGTTPFDRDTLSKLGIDGIRKLIQEQEPPRPSARISTLKAADRSTIEDQRQLNTEDIAKQLKREVDWIVMKALEKDRERRYETANAFAADVERFLNDEPVEACPPSTVYRLKKYARKHSGLVSTACLLIAVMLFAAGLLLNERNRTMAALVGERQQRTVAEKQQTIAEARKRSAQRSAREALRQRDTALRNQYVAETISGQLDLKRGYLHRLHRKLISHLPLTDQPDRRGWEWYWLWSQCHPEVRTLHASVSNRFANWSPDGEFIGASGDIWRAATGEAVRQIGPSNIKRSRSDWSLDGRFFAWGMASDDNGIYLWEPKTDQFRELRGHTESVWCLDFNPDGTRLASGGIDKTVRIWDVTTGQTIRILQTPNRGNDIAWSPDGELLAAGTADQHVIIWESANGDVVAKPKLPMARSGNTTQVSWHPTGDQLAICTSTSWCLIRTSDWTVTRLQDLELQRGSDISWSPDGETLAVSDGETVSLWDPSLEEPRRELRGHFNHIVNVSWSPDGQRLVSSDRSGEIKIWDLSVPFNPPEFVVEDTIDDLSWLPDNQAILVRFKNGSTSLWNTPNAQRLSVKPATFEGDRLWSRDQRLVASFSRTGNKLPEVRILDTEDKTVRAIWRGDEEAKILKLAWSVDRKMLAIATSRPDSEQVEFDVVIWSVDNEQIVSKWSYAGPFDPSALEELQIDWGPSGDRIAISALGTIGDNGNLVWQGHVYVVDVMNGTTILKQDVGGANHRGQVSSLNWRPDGRVVVAGTSDGLIEAVEAESGRIVFSTRLHSTPINSLAWSPDGRRIVSAAQDGSVKLLTGDTGEDLLTFDLDSGAIHVAWSPLGDRLAATTASGRVRVWDASRAYELSELGNRRGELAWAYYQSSVRETPAEKRIRLQKFLALAPDTLDFWQFRGNARASLGDFERAAEEYAKAIRPGLSRSFRSALFYGYTLLGAGKIDTYRRHCQSMLDTFAETEVPSTGGDVAWMCALTPNDQLNKETVLRLAATNAEVNDGGDKASLVLGAASFRSGQYEKAAAILTNVVAKLKQSGRGSAGSDLASATYFLAMARYQLGHSFQARRHLDEAADATAELKLAGEPAWNQKLTLELLRKEAESLIADPIGDPHVD